jgi:hypothetical protein
MAEKRRTFKCKVCGQEHAGLLCTKYSSVRVLQPRAAKAAAPLLLAAPAPKPAKPKKAKKKKKPKKRKKPAKTAPQTTPTQTPEPAQ